MARWDKPTLLLFSARAARGSMSTAAFTGHVPGAAGQHHVEFARASFFIQEDQAAALAAHASAFFEPPVTNKNQEPP